METKTDAQERRAKYTEEHVDSYVCPVGSQEWAQELMDIAASVGIARREFKLTVDNEDREW